MKEVEYWKYCQNCKYKLVDQEDEPCNECLTYPAREDSHKPLKFELKEEK